MVKFFIDGKQINFSKKKILALKGTGELNTGCQILSFDRMMLNPQLYQVFKGSLSIGELNSRQDTAGVPRDKGYTLLPGTLEL